MYNYTYYKYFRVYEITLQATRDLTKEFKE